MALIYEIFEYFLKQFTEVPQEKACTNVGKVGKVGNPWEQRSSERDCHENNPN